MAVRVKLIVAYDGAPFAGWQSQASGNTVQDRLERALKSITGEPLRVHGAGRTDAGVHALGQCAHVDLPDARLTAERLLAAINSQLPSTIRVLRCGYATDKFHARFSARGKLYLYRIWAAPVLPPHEAGRAWHLAGALDVDTMRSAAQEFLGTHDFAGFAANRGAAMTGTVRAIRSLRVQRRGPLVKVEVDGDGFLYKMVRLMVGSLVRCATGKMSPRQVRDALEARTGRCRFAAPAQGLFLVRVRY